MCVIQKKVQKGSPNLYYCSSMYIVYRGASLCMRISHHVTIAGTPVAAS
jgi:hypothetical protein